MTLRLSAADFKKQFGNAFDNHTTQVKQSAAIRLPKVREPNKTESAYKMLLEREFPGYDIAYEPFSLNLPSGTRYTPDWVVMAKNIVVLMVETKGSYRLGSADASARAFKEAISAFPQFKFRHATKSKDASGWSVTEPKQ